MLMYDKKKMLEKIRTYMKPDYYKEYNLLNVMLFMWISSKTQFKNVWTYISYE